MRVLVFPRDPNPYQQLLYGEMERLGVHITYVGELTFSQTLNVFLLPFETVLRRITGVRILHLHWVFTFSLPGARRLPALRYLAYIWFLVWLRTCRTVGMHLVWTAHNVLPHGTVFANDVSARRALVRACDLVLAHSQSTLNQLAALGAEAGRSAVVPHGPIAPPSSSSPLSCPGSHGQPYRFLFIGRVHEYKGVDDLLAAFLTMPAGVAAHLTVAGQCNDSTLAARLSALAQRGGARIVLRLERIPQDEITSLLAAADVVVLPFRRVTTSGSAILALSHGRPLIVPELAGLAAFPDQAVLRYDGKIPGLAAALSRLASVDSETLAAMSAAASAFANDVTWREIAEKTAAELGSVLGDHS